MAVDLRLARSEQVEIGAVEDEDEIGGHGGEYRGVCGKGYSPPVTSPLPEREGSGVGSAERTKRRRAGRPTPDPSRSGRGEESGRGEDRKSRNVTL
jgi:hypothetical protein